MVELDTGLSFDECLSIGNDLRAVIVFPRTGYFWNLVRSQLQDPRFGSVVLLNQCRDVLASSFARFNRTNSLT